MTRALRFRDRADAGQQLGVALRSYAGQPGVVVLGLPRGGVPIADAVARALGAPLDVFTVRKLGVPGQPELAMGAIATGGAFVLDEDTIAMAQVTPAMVDAVARDEERELHRREELFRGIRPPVEVAGSTVIVVDDGMATGATMRAAVAALRRLRAREIIVAAPVASREACAALIRAADRCVCLSTPEPLSSIGQWYEDFTQVEDDEVRAVLASASAVLPELAAAGDHLRRRRADLEPPLR